MKRFGLLGDIHSEDTHLAVALDVFRRESVDCVLAVGDIVDGPGDVDRCVQLLVDANVTAVRGNHDRWCLTDSMRTLPDAHHLSRLGEKTSAYLKTLQATVTIETSSGALLLCHGVSDNDMVRLGPDDHGYALESIDELQELLKSSTIRFVVGGHTHRRMVRAFERPTGDELVVVNCGTLKRGNSPCFAILSTDEGVQFFDFMTTGALLRSDFFAFTRL